VRITEGELIALFLAERLMQQFQGTPYAADVTSAFAKLSTSLPDEVSVNLEHLRESYSYRPTPVAESDVKRFALLAQAVREHRRLQLDYWTASRDTTTSRQVDPYHLTSSGGEWYLIGYCHVREDVRMFAPARIRKLQMLDETFELPADFNVMDYLDGSLRTMRGDKAKTVRLRFGAVAARYVRERTWHPSQKLKELPDRRLELTLRLTHLLEVKRWALSWGGECEVLKPDELRDEVAHELRQAVIPYK
jgi:predicted DNA-binding transcriptional regulator YafY